MEEWKQAAALAKYELRRSKVAVIQLAFMLITYILVVVFSAPIVVEKGFFLFDLFFLIFIGMAATWAKPKDFQINKMKNGSWGTPYFALLHQLPIPRKVLIKNRFIIYFVYSIPMHMIFLVSIYIFSDTIRTFLAFPEYIAFAIIWIMFGIYWGVSYPLVDIGEVKKMGAFKMTLYTVLFFVPIIGGGILLQQFTGYGVVYWSMMFAKNWPVVSSILSISLAIVCVLFALHHANKKIRKIDY